ncbi:pyruvate, water dikinase [Desulfonatronum thiosulfatophilum]|uniref:Phosphoenolpyruvate synthase n=1 Tax=Desulfonatronum thiosulfatophilum TaxID=617002 RepID=A0A1G6DBD1_9BACT|nr:PEP/pyruvate-binding domain-containing protein [Desulfonatronum thiosulfatophilum]SDB42438.1 pyruvate, water dikinase [Desulfonatronum thiosulfatophilum]
MPDSTQHPPTCAPLPTMDGAHVQRYRHFRDLLNHGQVSLLLIAELEQLYYDIRPFTLPRLERDADRLLAKVQAMIFSLENMTREKEIDYRNSYLHGTLKSIERSIRDELRPYFRLPTTEFILHLEDVSANHGRAVGAKAANLAKLQRDLSFPVPRGFVVTTAAFHAFWAKTGLQDRIESEMAEVDTENPKALEVIGRKIRSWIMETPLPDDLEMAITQSGMTLTQEGSTSRLAVRSSAVGEDTETSFAGQYESVLNVSLKELIRAYKTVVASKYSAAALSYRLHHGLDDRETPMAVLILEMIEPQLSGVAYTADPVTEDQQSMRISAVSGLGGGLVGGSSSPDWSWRLEKKSFGILEESFHGQDSGLMKTDGLDRKLLSNLWRLTLRMEIFFQRPLDIEWAVDAENHLYFLQARPLLVVKTDAGSVVELSDEQLDHPVLLDGGQCASGGVAAGRVMILDATELEIPEESLQHMAQDSILVSPTASTALTPMVGMVRGIVTDVGSTASHLASVAREFGVPALFNTGQATKILKQGQEITLWASRGRIYHGVVEELARNIKPLKRPVFASPGHLRMQRLLDLISPLNLTDPLAPEFQKARCLTLHDIIRYCHEQSVQEMFAFGKDVDAAQHALRLKVSIPVQLYALDLDDGFRTGLTTCDEINVHDVASVPFQALWQGLAHPGLNWTSNIASSARGFLSLVSTNPESGREDALGGASYAFVSRDYLNLNIRFGYHLATVDALCGPDPELNYVTLHFAGGVAPYFSRSLRAQYMAEVLKRLGYTVTLRGDLIEASQKRLDQTSLQFVLDQTGRLLGSARLLDMAMNSPEQVVEFTDAFFEGRYDYHQPADPDAPETYYLINGYWRKVTDAQEDAVLQDGSQFASLGSVAAAQTMGRLIGKRYQEFLDTIEAYYYFPLAIAKDSLMGNGVAHVQVKPVSGDIDQAGGLAFGIRDWDNYFVFRINALEDNAILFEFRNGKRLQRQEVEIPIAAGSWHDLRVEHGDGEIRAYLNDSPIMTHQADRPLQGYVGLWTKADSVTLFRKLQLQKMSTG